MNIFPSSSSPLLCLQQTQTIRLQRLIQQRKRMQHMGALIQQQKNTIQIFTLENDSMHDSYCKIKLQNQLLNDKLTIANNHAEQLSQTILKQQQLIEAFRHMLHGQDLHITEYDRRLLLEQIERGSGISNFVGRDKNNVKANYLSSVNQSKYTEQIARLTQQNQQLGQKYEQLCKNFLQLSKDNKLKQFEMKRHFSKSHNHSKSKRQSSSTTQIQQMYTHLIFTKDNEINQLSKKIQQLALQVKQKDKLIKEHRKNQKEQKKLLDYLKAKFNLQGKQLLQIAATNNRPSQLVERMEQQKGTVYEHEKIAINRTETKMSQGSPGKITSIANNDNCNLNGQTSCIIGEANSKSKRKPLEDSNPNDNQPTSSGFKRTVAKHGIEV